MDAEIDGALDQTANDATAVTEPRWVDVGGVDEVARRKKVVIDGGDDQPIVVVAHGGSFYAMDNICIHRQRELAKGVVLNGRLICPGHQWAFDLACGWEAVKEQCQPTYSVRVADGIVQVDANSRRVLVEPPARSTSA